MKIEKKKLAELKPSPYNPRTISKDQLERLKDSIEKFDLVEPIIWNKQTGHVVGGHQRLKVLQSLDRKETEVVVVDLKDSEEKALNLALNKISGEWDFDKLKEVILEIDTGEFPIELTGFDYDELSDLIDYSKDEIIPQSEEDDVPEPPEEPISKIGDVWILGEHLLLCGDCTDQKEVDRLMDNDKADMIFTDPPYNVNYEDTHGRKIKNDNLKDFKGFLIKIYDSLLQVSKTNACAYVCYAEANVMDFMTCALEAKWTYRNTLIWLKDIPAMNFGHYTWQYEPILYLSKGTPKFYGQKNHPNVIEVASYNSFAGRKDDHGNAVNRALHPNQKPVELIVKVIENSSKKNQIVADFFGGSGSTLIACEKTARRARIIELDPIYCDVIVKRWETYTGQEAKKQNA